MNPRVNLCHERYGYRWNIFPEKCRTSDNEITMKKLLLPLCSFAAVTVVTSVFAASYAVKNLDLNDG